jgi:hypothetical protein
VAWLRRWCCGSPGLLPLILHELDAISWKIGSTHMSVRNLIEGAVTAVLVLVLALWVSAALEAKLLRAPPTTCPCARWRPTRCARCCCWWA